MKYKLKENIDLKELEKYGFKIGCQCIDKEELWSRYDKHILNEYNELGYPVHISIYDGNHWTKRQIMSGISNIKNKWIKDLIKADLVEKIED